MITSETARQLALSLPEAIEQDHFGMPSFRVRGKIFMTLQPALGRAMVKLSLVDQSVFVLAKFYWPVPGGWGKQGATYVDLKKVGKRMLQDSVTQVWLGVAPKRLVAANPALGHPHLLPG